MTTKASRRDNGELSARTWADYHDVCDMLVSTFGRDRFLTDLLPDDFEKLRAAWSEKWGPVRLSNHITYARVVFNYAYKNGLIDRPMRYGEGFQRPSKKTLRIARAEKGIRMFEAAELRKIIKAAGQPMEAMILLAVNTGMGNNDVGQLPMSAIDLDGGWLNFSRPKTGIMRRCALWPETVKAIRAWLKVRPTAVQAGHAELVFTTVRGGSWSKGTTDNPVSKEMRKLLDGLKIEGNRNFYSLRHTFETIGGESRDQIAVNAIMGHIDTSMSATYRERISDERFQAVAEHVRTWLFAKPAKAGKAKTKHK